MTLNDRVALLLGRSIIRAEELAVRLEEAQARVVELETLEAKQQEEKGGP